jgi:anaerobic selenocysteine-containing dehydrogenase
MESNWILLALIRFGHSWTNAHCGHNLFRNWGGEMATDHIHTYCAMCISRCGVLATVEDGRFAKVSMDPEHPNGCICTKGAAAPEIVYSPDRLRHPMRRTRPKGDPDPGWERISWEEAIQTVCDRLARIKETNGPEAVVFGCATPAGSATDDIKPWVIRLSNAFGSPNHLEPGHVCTWNRMSGSRYTYGAPTPEIDFEHTNCILLWGTNPQATQPATAMRITHARRRGAKLIVIDPREHALARKADCWLRVRPGTDGALALAMIHVLLEERLVDQEFLLEWTNAPFLIRDDTGALLTMADLTADNVGAGFAVWNQRSNRPVSWSRELGYSDDNVIPNLFGRFDCTLPDGSQIGCRTVLDALRTLAAEYAPEISEKITWVPAAKVREAVRLFMQSRPSAYESWTGTEMHTAAGQMNRAIHCFYSLTGQFDQCGSNVAFAATATLSPMGNELLPAAKRALILGLSEHPLGPPRHPQRVQHANVYRAILEGVPYQVKAMVLFGADVLIGHVAPQRGRQALEALDFHVHVDLVESPTAKFADILLPACTSWESEAVRASFRGAADTNNWSQLRKAVIAPLHASKPDLEILFDLAQGLGLGSEFFGGDLGSAWDQFLKPSGITVDELRANPVGLRSAARSQYCKYRESNGKSGRPRGFATPSGRLELFSAAYFDAGYAPLPEYEEPVESPLDSDGTYPLVLTSFRTIDYIGPQYRNVPSLRARQPEPFMELNPEAAEAAGVANGDWAFLENRSGKVKLRVRTNSSLHPAVVCAPYGWWQGCEELDLPSYDPFGPTGANVNLLISEKHIDPISASVPHRSSMCRVSPCEPT